MNKKTSWVSTLVDSIRKNILITKLNVNNCGISFSQSASKLCQGQGGSIAESYFDRRHKDSG